MPSEAQNAASLIGRTIGGRYTIKATIGSGGMGHVYRATQAPINREVAIKVLRVDLAHQEGVAERFKREARAASMIQHPNAITIFDFDQDGEILYLAMEFLSGETLRQRLRREPPMEIDEALDMFESMAGALGAAHKVGVVHRDLKPDNIFLAKFDTVGQVVKVLDFGLAKLLDRAADNEGLVTEANLRLGTPRYMAPEQALGIQPIDSRCDVYALGLLLFEMLAQRAPFTGEDGMEVLAQRLRKEAPRLSTVAQQKNFSEQLDDLLATMLKRDREHRPQDANMVLARIRELRKNGQIHRDPNELPTAPAEPQGRSGAFAKPGVGRTPPGVPRRPDAGQPPPSRPAAEAMVRLDQDDFPEKPTVVVDPGQMDMMRSPGMQPMMQSSSNYGRPSGPMSMPGMPEHQAPMQMYSSSPNMGMSAPNFTPATTPSVGSGSAPPVQQKRKRTVLIVALVIAVAVLAPVLALLFRAAKSGDEHADTPSPESLRNKAPTKPPPPPEPEVKPPTEPVVDPAANDKGNRKGPGKKKGPTKPKSDGKSDAKGDAKAKGKGDSKPIF